MRVLGVLLLLLVVGAGVWSVWETSGSPAPRTPPDPKVADDPPLFEDLDDGEAVPPSPRAQSARKPAARPRRAGEPRADEPPADAEEDDAQPVLRGRVRLPGGRPAAGARVRAWDVDRTFRGLATQVG